MWNVQETQVKYYSTHELIPIINYLISYLFVFPIDRENSPTLYSTQF